MSKRSAIWIAAASALVVIQGLAWLLLRPGQALIAVSDLTQGALLLSGTLVFLPNVWATRGRIRLFWCLTLMGMALWFTYQLLWIYFEVYLRQDVPNPFVGDVILFLHIVPMMAALALQPHVEQDERTTRLGSLDFALLLTWWVYLYLFAVIPWQYASPDETLYEHNLNVLYLTEKLVLLGGLLLMWSQSKGGWRRIYAYWFGATAAYGVFSYLANWAIEKNIYYTGSLYDVPLAASMAWVTAVGLIAFDLAPKQEPARNSLTHGVWVARMGMIAVFSLPLFAVWALFDSSVPGKVRTFRLVVTLATMFVMGTLVFLKQHLLDRELTHLLRSSQDSFENLQKLQTQLVQSEKMASLGQLVGGAAHELNNPLTAMLGYSDLLAGTPLNEPARTLSEKMAHQVRRTRTLVSSLLAFARQVPGQKVLLDLNSLAHTALKLAQPQLSARNIKLQSRLAERLPQVLGDSNQLLQVCLHLTNNFAQMLADSGATLTVSSRTEGNFVLLEFSEDVASTAAGEESPDALGFSSSAPGIPSLGFSTCYGIVQEHRGRIMSQPRSEGGPLCRIELPISTASVAPDSDESSASLLRSNRALTFGPSPDPH